MADERLQDRGEIQLLLFDEVLMFGTSLTQMHFLLLTGHYVGQMNRGWAGAALAFHVAFLREGPVPLPCGASTPLPTPCRQVAGAATITCRTEALPSGHISFPRACEFDHAAGPRLRKLRA